jgi:hypothetical protein
LVDGGGSQRREDGNGRKDLLVNKHKRLKRVEIEDGEYIIHREDEILVILTRENCWDHRRGMEIKNWWCTITLKLMRIKVTLSVLCHKGGKGPCNTDVGCLYDTKRRKTCGMKQRRTVMCLERKKISEKPLRILFRHKANKGKRRLLRRNLKEGLSIIIIFVPSRFD